MNSELCFWFPCSDDRLLHQLGFLYSPEDQVKSKARQLLKNLHLYFTVVPYTSHASTQEAHTNKHTVSALQSPVAINKEGRVLFFLFFFQENATLFLFNCTKFTPWKVGKTPKPRRSGALRSECDLRVASGVPGPRTCSLGLIRSSHGKVQCDPCCRQRQVGEVALLSPPVLCLTKQRNAWRPPTPAAISPPELAAGICAFSVVLPSRVGMGWLC